MYKRQEYEQFAISSEIELEDRLLEKEQEEQCESSDEDDTEVASGEKDENRPVSYTHLDVYKRQVINIGVW